MQQTTTTCDRCGASTDKADLKWNSLYAGEDIDLCPTCCADLIKWVDAGTDLVTVHVPDGTLSKVSDA